MKKTPIITIDGRKSKERDYLLSEQWDWNYESGWSRYGYFKTKREAKKFADNERRNNRSLGIEGVSVRVKKLAGGWIVDEYDV